MSAYEYLERRMSALTPSTLPEFPPAPQYDLISRIHRTKTLIHKDWRQRVVVVKFECY